METVTVTRTIDASPERVRAAIEADVPGFIRAGGFDGVTVEGDRIRLTKRVGIATMTLTVRVTPDDEAVLAYEAVEGVFEAMETTISVTPVDNGTRTEVTGYTAFSLDTAIVGDLLAATVVKRQRRLELAGSFDWLATRVSG